MHICRLLAVFFSLLMLGSGCDIISAVGGSKPGVATRPGQTVAGPVPQGPISGQVLDRGGKPAAHIAVRAFLNNASPLVGNTGGALAGNAGGALNGANPYWTLAARRIAAGTEVKTDAAGRFALDLDQDGTYNVEAVENDSSKAWQAGVEFKRGRTTEIQALQLAPTGHISGKVKSSRDSVTDLSHTQVYIPGSSYLAVTRSDGAYTISNVPVGKFELAGYNVELGDGRLPDQDHPGLIRVDSGETTGAPILVLRTYPPELGTITRARSSAPTDNAAPGAEIDLHGKYFGHNRGIRFEVRFSGGTASKPERLTEDLIRVKVPADAQNGNVLVFVGALDSGGVPLRVMKSFSLDLATLSIAVGGTYDLAKHVAALDTKDLAIVEVKDGDRVLKHGPSLEWSVDSDRGVVTERGMLTIVSVGTLKVTARAGDLAPAVVTVTAVQTAASPTPAPTPAPDPTPTVAPSAIPAREIKGIVTTLAGSFPYGNPEGQGTAAFLAGPWGIALDPAGNVIVVDTWSHRILKVTPAGAVNVLAGAGIAGSLGGPAATARFDNPRDVAVDPAGNVYVADNRRVRRIGTDGQVTWVAGTGGNGHKNGPALEAEFYPVESVAIDATGNIFVTADMTAEIRKIDPSGNVTTLAGDWTQPGNVDGKGAAARFSGPKGLAAASDGTVFVADAGNDNIRRIAPDGTVTTVPVGSHDRPLKTPIDVFVEPSGTLLVTAYGGIVWRLDGKGSRLLLAGDHEWGFLDGLAAMAEFARPHGVVGDAAGNVYVADEENRRIRKISPSGTVSTLAGDSRADGGASTARFNKPFGLAVDRDGNVFVADRNNHCIRRVAPDGMTTTFAGSGYRGTLLDGTGQAAQLQYPQGLAIDPSGNLFFAGFLEGMIRKISPNGTVSRFVGGGWGSANGSGTSAQFSLIEAMAFDTGGNLYAVERNGIRKITPQGVVTRVAGLGEDGGNDYVDGPGASARFRNPKGIAVAADGTLFVSDTQNHRIRKVSPDGIVSTFAGSGEPAFADGTGTAAKFLNPGNIAIDKAGTLYVADTDNHVIRKITPAGVVTTLAGDGNVAWKDGKAGWADGTGSAARFNYPKGLAIGPDGRLYVSDFEGDRIRVIE